MAGHDDDRECGYSPASCAWKSRPLMSRQPDIEHQAAWRIRQRAFRNSAAEPNTCVRKPTELNRSLSASRSEASSSTTRTVGAAAGLAPLREPVWHSWRAFRMQGKDELKRRAAGRCGRPIAGRHGLRHGTTIDSPIPIPLGFVVKKALNSSASIAGSKPGPESSTATRTSSSSLRRVRTTSSRLRSATDAMAWMALTTRLMIPAATGYGRRPRPARALPDPGSTTRDAGDFALDQGMVSSITSLSRSAPFAGPPSWKSPAGAGRPRSRAWHHRSCAQYRA